MAMPATSYQVTGMSCDHCVHVVSTEISRVAGVRHVEVDLASGRVTVASEAALDDGAVRAAVEAAGDEVAS